MTKVSVLHPGGASKSPPSYLPRGHLLFESATDVRPTLLISEIVK